MQHEHVLKKYTSSPILGGGMGMCGQNIYYHVSAFLIPFNLICNVSVLKKLKFDLLTPSLGLGGSVGV